MLKHNQVEMDMHRVPVIANEKLEKTLRMSEDIVQQIVELKAVEFGNALKWSTIVDSKVEEMQKTNEELEKQIISVQAAVDSQREKVEELSRRAAEVRKENCELKVCQQECHVEQRKKEVFLRKEGLVSHKSAIASRGKVKANVAKYMELLNMEIKRSSDNSLIFIFKHVDEKDPTKGFYFKVKLEEDTYKIPACEPPVDDLNKLVENLNSSNNLQDFVVQMRKRFRQLVSQT